MVSHGSTKFPVPATSRLAPSMSLRDLLDRYMAAHEVRLRYAESLRRTIKKAEGSGIKKICQLTPDRVNKFLADLPLSDTTRHNIRRELLTLWKWAYEEQMTSLYPVRIRKIRPTYAPPQTWHMLDLERLVEAAEADETPISSRLPLRRKDVLPAWIGLCYESGMRFEDVHKLHKKHLRNGCVAISANKTGKPLVRAISPKTQAKANRLLGMSPDGTIFKWALPRRRAFGMWREFLDEHELGGSSKWLRRAAATQKHLEEPGSATEFLQHSDPKLALRHYIDASQAAIPKPPRPIGK